MLCPNHAFFRRIAQRFANWARTKGLFGHGGAAQLRGPHRRKQHDRRRSALWHGARRDHGAARGNNPTTPRVTAMRCLRSMEAMFPNNGRAARATKNIAARSNALCKPHRRNCKTRARRARRAPCGMAHGMITMSRAATPRDGAGNGRTKSAAKADRQAARRCQRVGGKPKARFLNWGIWHNQL